jgi:septal ring factor EnvC (AmiA/AmiB activator)
MYHKLLIGWFTAGFLFFVGLWQSAVAVFASLSLNDATNFTAILTVVIPGIAGALAGFFFIVIPGWAKAKAAARKIDDDSRKDSLSAKLDEMNDSLAKSRKNQHDISGKLQELILENHFLQTSLHTANENSVKFSRELSSANDTVIKLTNEVSRLKGEVTRMELAEAQRHRESKVIVDKAEKAADKITAAADKIDRATSFSSSSGAGLSGSGSSENIPVVASPKLD